VLQVLDTEVLDRRLEGTGFRRLRRFAEANPAAAT
jgi:hypothetical protein